jgi:O-antigen/teichoic acid export membrane protein
VQYRVLFEETAVEDRLVSEPLTRPLNSAKPKSSVDSPVFIVGMSRSGTTLLSRMLDSHSEIAILPETWMYVVLDRLGCLEDFSDSWQASLFFNEVWKNLKSYRDPAASVLAREAAREVGYIGPTATVLEKLGRAYAKERNARIWGEKTPGHALWLPQIRTLFPQARILFVVRDPRDVLVSYDERWDEGARDTDYLVSTASLLKYYMTHLLHRPSFPPEQVRWVRYESLVSDPSAELEKICEFLGINYEPSMLAFYHRHANVERDMPDGEHHALLGRPATTEKIGRFREALSPSQIALIERHLSEEMQILNYPLAAHRDSPFTSAEKKSLAKGEKYYREMMAGQIRRRFRRRGKIKLRAYQIFGRALEVVPSWRVATSENEWLSLTDNVAQTSVARSASGAGQKVSPVVEKPNFTTEMGRISRQSGVAFAGTIFTALVGYAFKIYLARFLGADALGLYALGMTLISFLGMINVLGLPESAVRFVALYSASKRFHELRSLLWNGSWILLATNVVLSAILLRAGPWIVSHLYHSPQLARYLPLFAAIMLTSAFNGFYGNVLTGYREVGRRTVIAKFVASPVTAAATVVLVSLGFGLSGYLAAQVVSSACVLVLLICFAWRFTPVVARRPDLKKLWINREVWSFSAAMFGIGLMQFFMVQTDRVALGIYRGAHDVGIYAIVASLIAYETIFLQSVNQIFAPVIADIHSRGEHALLGRLFQTLTKWILGLTFPLAIVLIVYSRPIMAIFGHEFEAGWLLLVIGTCGQIVNCGVGSVGFLLLMSGNERRLVRVQMVMATVMVLLCFKLVPLWGALGAVIAAAVTNIGMNVWNLVEVRKVLNLSPYNKSYLKLLPSVCGAVFVTLLVSRASVFQRAEVVGIAVSLTLGYLVFCALSFAMGLDADDRLITGAVWARVRTTFGSRHTGN